MKILTLRTDQEIAEIGLFLDLKQIDYLYYEHKNELAEHLLQKIKQICQKNKVDIKELDGVVIFKGPGSFTGLRIGISLANSLVYSLAIPIIGAKGKDWLRNGLKKILKGENQKIISPYYGADVRVTKQKK